MIGRHRDAGRMIVPAPALQHVTKQQFVYGLLRSAIIKCELAPGERLVIDELARRFQVSIIPVREALRVLQSEGLVVSVAHTGTTVAPISRASVYEVFTILEGLEVVSTRAAASRATQAELDKLTRIVRAMDEAVVNDHPADWADLNTAFHLAIGRVAGMPLLEDMLRRALDNWDRIRRHYFRDVLARRIPQAQDEHQLILTQITQRDLPALELTVRAHNQRALESYSSYLDSAADL
jgi:DNA-binding GntR family transcriptional regulator